MKISYEKRGHTFIAKSGQVVGKGETKTEALSQLKNMIRLILSLTNSKGEIIPHKLKNIKIKIN